jgi:serine/threonine protein kinase
LGIQDLRFEIQNLKFEISDLKDPHPTRPRSRQASPSPVDWSVLRDVVRRFEEDRRRGLRGEIGDYLPPAELLRTRALIELVHIDLELRLKEGQVARVEEYLRRYPHLAADADVVIELIVAEYRLRRRGGAPSVSGYVTRFPQYGELAEKLGELGMDDRTAPLDSEPVIVSPPSVAGYEVLELVGRGGMGVVYRARQLGLGRDVALKMVLSDAHVRPRDLARFRAEAAALARLQHPNIVQIYDVGEAGSGKPYFAFEFVAGGTLAQHLRGSGAPQAPGAAAKLIETLARAVQAAHANGVIHRDLKPANILLCDRGGGSGDDLASIIPKITDFGLAKCAEDREETPADVRGPTATGELLGTPNYMAPEQATTPRQPVGPGADVYALGAILYELLTGRPPFTGPTAVATIIQVIHNEPVPVAHLQPGVPKDLETICLKCLRKEARQRYGSAQELAEDIGRFLRDEPIRARPVRTMEKLRRWVRGHPTAAGLLAAGLIAPVVALVTLSLLSARLVRSAALESAMQQAELLEESTKEYSRIVQRVEEANFVVNKMVPPTAGAVPLSIPATFLHDVGEQLSEVGRTGVKVRQYSDQPFPWRVREGGPHDEFERRALRRLRDSGGQETTHEFTEMGGQRVVRYAQARVMASSCVECHNTHPQSPRTDWRVGDVRGVLEIIRPLEKDEARVGAALRLALLISAVVSGLLLGGSMLVVWVGRRRGGTTRA